MVKHSTIVTHLYISDMIVSSTTGAYLINSNYLFYSSQKSRLPRKTLCWAEVVLSEDGRFIMISCDSLLWSPCVSQACWWVGICQEGEYIWEGLLFSSQTWLSTLKAFVTAPQFLTEEELCPHRRGLEQYKVLILSFRTSLRHLSFSHELLYVVFCTYLENTPWFISSAGLLFTVYRSHFSVVVVFCR